jgi:sugar lactone lactonase YvrE
MTLEIQEHKLSKHKTKKRRSYVMKKLMLVVSTIFILALALVPLASAQGGGMSLGGGFNAPQGVLVAPDGSVWVIDSGLGGDTEVPVVDPETGEDATATFGETARVVRIDPDGTQTVAATLPSLFSGEEALGGARLALMDGAVYATSGGWLGGLGPVPSPAMAAVVKIEEGAATPVASGWDLEEAQNPDGFILEAHPYDITAGPDGMLWVADAGANDLWKLDPMSGEVQLVTVFSEGVPGPFPNPNRGGAMESDPVPTGIAFDGSGNAYVSFLPGFPFLPGSPKVVRVSSDGQVSDYATGLTMVTDLQTGPDGEMYAVQVGQFTEQGPVPNSGAIVRVKEGDGSEVVVDGLSFPTSIDFNADGDAYVTINGVGAPGSGEVVMFAAVTAQPGESMMVGPGELPTTGGEPALTGWAMAGMLALGLTLVAGGFALKRRTSLNSVSH